MRMISTWRRRSSRTRRAPGGRSIVPATAAKAIMLVLCAWGMVLAWRRRRSARAGRLGARVLIVAAAATKPGVREGVVCARGRGASRAGAGGGGGGVVAAAAGEAVVFAVLGGGVVVVLVFGGAGGRAGSGGLVVGVVRGVVMRVGWVEGEVGRGVGGRVVVAASAAE